MSPTASPLTYRQTLTVLSGLMLGMLLAGLDQTIVATAARTIGDDLGGLDQQAWLTTAFLVTSTITTLLYGKLSDLFGRKRLYMLAIGIFLAGSALCGVAGSMATLAVFRAVQGLGAGGLMSLAFAITGDIIPPRERAKYQGWFAATMAVSSVLGPVLGGLFAGLPTFVGIAGWRWVFWVNLPLGIVALAIIARTLRIDQAHRAARIDLLGAALVAIAVVPALLVGEEGGSWGWASGGAIACYSVAAASTIAFILQQRRMGDDALLPLSLFRSQTFTVATLLAIVLGALQLGGIAVLPLYLQIVYGAGPTQAGLLMLPMVLGISAASILAGRFTARTGHYKPLPITGMVLQVLAFAGLSTVHATTPLWIVDVWMLLIGLGIGASMTTLILAMQNAADPSRMGVATAAGTFFRNLGGTAGTAVLLTLLFNRAGHEIGGAYAAAGGTNAFHAAAAAHPDQLQTLQRSLSQGLNDTSFLHGLSSALAQPFLDGFSSAMDTTFLIAAGLAAAGLVLAVVGKEVPLRLLSGTAARAAATTADPIAPAQTTAE